MSGYSKEEAINVLNNNPKMEASYRAYWEAIVNGTLPEYYLREFLIERDEFSDDLPEIDVRKLPSKKEGGHDYKCQVNYLIRLNENLKAAIKDSVITDISVIDSVNTFLSTDLAFSVGNPKNTDNINNINAILNHVINSLQS